MATKTNRIGNCPKHGEFYMDDSDSPCPTCDALEYLRNCEEWEGDSDGTVGVD